MERVMECHYDFDLTYITERMISVFFPSKLEEQRYHLNLKEVAAMLKSKHQDKFLVREQKCSTLCQLRHSNYSGFHKVSHSLSVVFVTSPFRVINLIQLKMLVAQYTTETTN